MCNPSKSPTKASASSQPQSSAAIPPSPASTSATSRMSSSSSSSVHATAPSPASRDTRRSNATSNSTAPILKLVATLRNSQEGLLIRSPPRQPVIHRIIRRPGQESRDDARDDSGNHSEPPPGSFRPIHAQHEDEEEDEIPALIEEDQDRYTSPIEEALQQQQQQDDDDDEDDDGNPNEDEFLSYEHPSQRRTLSLPVTKRKIPIESSNNSAHHNKQEQDCMGEGTMPFFVLDWMIDDLVPEQQNAQELANILRQQESQQTFRNFERNFENFSPLRKSKSCGIVGSGSATKKKASPIIQRLLPWAGKTSSAEEAGATQIQIQAYRPSTPIKDPSEQPMLLTPKSSNRKSSKSRQKERKASLIDTNDDDDNDMDMPFAPRNLKDSLNDCQATATAAATSVDIRALHFPKFMPRVDSAPPQQHAYAKSKSKPKSKSNEKDSWMVANNKNDTTKKSASCPQLYQETDDDLDEHHALQQRQRAKEQHDRRERRNKLTVVQRSLTQAQGWNNKGLSMAGNATRAEQTTATQGQHAEQWWGSSLECWDNALEIYRSLLGEYHERVADVQNNRGIALGKLGRFDEALVALGMALEARKRQERRSTKENNSFAIVSTMHNIANVFRDAGNPSEALRVLVEAQTTLRAQLESSSEKDDESSVYHFHHCWHQSARLSTAIGHVYHESESFKDARDAYGEALEAYDKLRRSLGKHSDELGWGDHQQDPNESNNRLELLHHQQLIQREVSVLQKDLDELDRSQQARDGSRARLLQARRQQQQQQNYRRPSNRAQQQQQQQQQPQHQKQPQTLFGIVSSLRA